MPDYFLYTYSVLNRAATLRLVLMLTDAPRAASLLLGQAVEYDLGNVFDPAYTMVCKIAKKYLPLPGAGTLQ